MSKNKKVKCRADLCLVDLCLSVTTEDEQYTLYQEDDGMFLENKDGEGMTVFPEELFRMLDKHFKENF